MSQPVSWLRNFRVATLGPVGRVLSNSLKHHCWLSLPSVRKASRKSLFVPMHWNEKGIYHSYSAQASSENWKFGIARGRAFPPHGGEASRKAYLASLVVFLRSTYGQAPERTGSSGLREDALSPEGRLQGKPFSLRSWSFSLPSLAQASLARSGNEKAQPRSGWAFFGGEGGIARGRAFPGGEASRKALLASLVGFFAPFPRPSKLGSVRERKSPATSWLGLLWRRGRDSNPRYPCGHICFRDRPDRPLWHLSGSGRQI